MKKSVDLEFAEGEADAIIILNEKCPCGNQKFVAPVPLGMLAFGAHPFNFAFGGSIPREQLAGEHACDAMRAIQELPVHRIGICENAACLILKNGVPESYLSKFLVEMREILNEPIVGLYHENAATVRIDPAVDRLDCDHACGMCAHCGEAPGA